MYNSYGFFIYIQIQFNIQIKYYAIDLTLHSSYGYFTIISHECTPKATFASRQPSYVNLAL